MIVKERFNVSLSFTARRPSLKTLDRSFTNYIIIWPRKKHYMWDWNLPGNRVKAWDFLPHFLLRSYRSNYQHWVHWLKQVGTCIDMWSSLFLTCQSTVYQVTLSNNEPCALMVENNVWPALLRTAGLGSTHSSPILEYRAIHILSGTGRAGSSRVGSTFWPSSFSRASSIATRFWFKKSEIFH